MKPKSRRFLPILALCGATLLSSCASPALKAPPAKVSAFLGPQPPLKDDRRTTPFALSGGTLTAPQHGIYIAPVSLDYLRPADKSLAKAAETDASRDKAARELAGYGRTRFMAAFRESTTPRYQLRTTPDHDCLVLELAITELNRNTVAGALPRFVLNNVAVPGAESVLSKATRGLKGNISIEGKLRNQATGAILYQFADSEESRSAFLLPVTDFTPYGQAREALRGWARQFEEITRTAAGERVRDTGVISLF